MIDHDAALQAHARLGRALPCRSYNLLGHDQLALEKAGFRFRGSTNPHHKVAVRERVLRSLLAVGGKATITALVDHSGIARKSVRFALDGMLERGLVERISTEGAVAVYAPRARGPWDE